MCYNGGKGANFEKAISDSGGTVRACPRIRGIWRWHTDTIDYEYGNKIDEDGYKHARELGLWFNKAILDTDYWEDVM